MNATSAIASRLSEALEREGYRSALAPVDVARSLWEEIVSVRDEGLLARSMFDAYKGSWHLTVPEGVPEPRTLLAVAWPSMPVKLRFQMGGEAVDAVVPPTYIYSAERPRCLEVARSILGLYGHEAWWATVPVKPLAVHAGLAQYGRNNLVYVPGLGSYVRLGAICTDADLGAVDRGVEPTAGGGSDDSLGHAFMKECVNCGACSRACPTGCIPETGTVIDASHCLTQANENEGDWPNWVPARAHNSLVGCMRCQEACPVDRPYIDREADLIAEFDREETAMILEGPPIDQLTPQLRSKLADLDLDEYSTVLGRNLLALRNAART